MAFRLLAQTARRIPASTFAVVAGGSTVATCHGAGVDRARLVELEAQVGKLAKLIGEDVESTTGQGDMVFSWDREKTACFPADCPRDCQSDMHGGFTEDPATGTVYTGIPGYGFCAISPDLTTWARLGSDPRLKDNIHGLCCFVDAAGRTVVALAQNNDERVLIVAASTGAVLGELAMPKGGEFAFAPANAYYSKKPLQQMPNGAPHRAKFACTDVAYLDGKLYVVTGYCDGDFVLTATLGAEGEWTWGPLAWGGKGSGAGEFNTAHGVFAFGGNIYVANREAHKVVEFSKDGDFLRSLPDIPDTARICNVARSKKYFVMNALEPIQHTPAKTAPIFAHDGDALRSVIEPGVLGIPVLKHLHHTWPHYAPDGSLYLLIHGWSEGKFAVLKHEPQGSPSVPRGWHYWKPEDRGF